jgi:hypothetical protein
MSLARRGTVPLPFPPHVAEDVKEARAWYTLVKEQGRDGAAGIVQGEKGIAYIEFAEEHTEPGTGPASRLEPGAQPELKSPEGGD